MIGAIIGDIVGSRFEFKNIKHKKFTLFSEDCSFTDDTIMTIAVAEALLNGASADNFIDSMKKFGKLYPNPKGAYGGNFGRWLLSDDRKPYNSFGNGSAMRVSPCAWFAKSLEEAEELAERCAAVTHNHPEGIKGAKATAAAIYLARLDSCITDGDPTTKLEIETLDEMLSTLSPPNFSKGDTPEDIKAFQKSYVKQWEDDRKDVRPASKVRIKKYIESKYGYDLSRTLDEIRPGYTFNETCQETVPEAIIAFLGSWSFDDAIRNAVSLGGDSDTLAAITGSIAEAYYGISGEMFKEAADYLCDDLLSVINAWHIRDLPTGVEMVKKSSLLDYSHWEDPREFHVPHKIKTNIGISESQLVKISLGLWPEQMEDKWLIYFENGRICCHRSWTGHKVYEAEVQKEDSGYTISEILVERDAELYTQTDDAEDIQNFYFLIGRGLLGLKLDSPHKKESGTGLLRDWSEFGRMMVTSPSVSSKLNETIRQESQRQQGPSQFCNGISCGGALK